MKHILRGVILLLLMILGIYSYALYQDWYYQDKIENLIEEVNVDVRITRDNNREIGINGIKDVVKSDNE